jgi:hypothetical protein
MSKYVVVTGPGQMVASYDDSRDPEACPDDVSMGDWLRITYTDDVAEAETFAFKHEAHALAEALDGHAEAME